MGNSFHFSYFSYNSFQIMIRLFGLISWLITLSIAHILKISSRVLFISIFWWIYIHSLYCYPAYNACTYSPYTPIYRIVTQLSRPNAHTTYYICPTHTNYSNPFFVGSTLPGYFEFFSSPEWCLAANTAIRHNFLKNLSLNCVLANKQEMKIAPPKNLFTLYWKMPLISLQHSLYDGACWLLKSCIEHVSRKYFVVSWDGDRDP